MTLHIKSLKASITDYFATLFKCYFVLNHESTAASAWCGQAGSHRTRSLSGTDSRRKTWWEGVELQPNPREGGYRRGKEVWKEEGKSLAQAAQACRGGQTLMMPQCGCQQGHSQQAEGNVSATVETIRLPSSSSSSSSHGCTSGEKRGRRCFIKWWQIAFCRINLHN